MWGEVSKVKAMDFYIQKIKFVRKKALLSQNSFFLSKNECLSYFMNEEKILKKFEVRNINTALIFF